MRIHHLLIAIALSFTGIDASSQKLKCKLNFEEGIYIGGMKPNWFSIELTPTGNNGNNIVEAKGTFYNKDFGTAPFTITKNTLPTNDSLMISASFGWHPISNIEIKKETLRFDFDWSYRPVPREIDLRILERADRILSTNEKWDSRDDRNCKVDQENKKWSLYCAIYQASTDILNDFNHRSAALETIRNAINNLSPQRDYKHQIMDFNNESTFLDVKLLLKQSQESLAIMVNTEPN